MEEEIKNSQYPDEPQEQQLPPQTEEFLPQMQEDAGFEPVKSPDVDIEIPDQIADTQNTDIKTKDTQAQNKPADADMELITVSPVEFVSFEEEDIHLSDDPKANLDILQDVKMHITVELGRARTSVKKVLDLSKGSIVELNKVAGEQVELYANGKFIAYGEVIVIEDKFGLRVTNASQQNLHNI